MTKILTTTYPTTDSAPEVVPEPRVPTIAPIVSSIGITTPMDNSVHSQRTFQEIIANKLTSHWSIFRKANWEGEVTFTRLFALLPDGFVMTKSDQDPRGDHLAFVAVRLDEADQLDAAVLIFSYSGGSGISIDVAAKDPDTAANLGASVLGEMPPPKPDDPKIQWLRTWYHGGVDVDSTSRRVATEDWDEIQVNYPEAVRRDLDQLMTYRPPDDDNRAGRIVLLHGAPGTGKTSVVRALCKAWFDWCQPELLVDAEMVFSEASYLMQVLGRGPNRNGDYRPELWRLLIAEDADLFMPDGTTTKDNPALDRLLNIGDGMLAQGQRVLVLLSTNNKVSTLPPSLTRPGRCLSIHEFTPFSVKEATEWMGDGGPKVTKALTLAELFELRGSTSRIGAPTELKSVGTYL